MATIPAGIEKYICVSWSGWDLLDTGVFMFYDPVIHSEILESLGVSEVSHVVVNVEDCTVQFYLDHDGEDYIERGFILVLEEVQ